jgi:hypothetical protein
MVQLSTKIRNAAWSGRRSEGWYGELAAFGRDL